MKKIHLRSLRLYINAGMQFPECKKDEPLLDLNCTNWNMTYNKKEVTCKNCLNKIRREL
jgi:hypothetical protein